MSAIGIGISPVFSAEVPGWWISTGLKALAGGPLAMYVRESIISGTEWRDVSGNGYTATATGAGTPTVTATGLDFDGTSDFMTITGLTSASTDYTAVFVIEPDTVSGTQTLLGCNAPDAFHAVVSGSVGLHDGTGNRAGMVSTARLQLLVIRVKAAGTTIDFYRDGEKLATSTSYDGTFSFGTPVLGAAHGGASGWFDGEIRFAALWASALSDANLTTLESVLMTRFGIAYSPLSHAIDGWWTLRSPYITVAAGAVTAATDRSGLAHHLAVTGAGANITVAAGASPLGLDVVRFPGSGSKRLAAAWTQPQPHTRIIHAVLARAGGSGANKYTSDGQGAVGAAFVYTTAAGLPAIFAGTAVVTLATGSVTTWKRTRGRFDGINSAIAQNGGTATTGNAGGTAAGGIVLGAAQNGSSPADCDIAEVLSLPYVPTALELAALDAYLAGAA